MKIPKLQWVIAAMLCCATAINYCDRLTLSILSHSIRQQFSMTEQDYAHVITLFMLAYAIMYAGSGYVVDRLGTRRGFAVFVFAWSLGSMAHGLAQGKWSLAACQFTLGLAEPGNWPAAAKAVAEWFPASQRALGVGIFNAGTSLGSTLAAPVVAFLTLRYGWRYCFVFMGAVGLAWMAGWLVLYQPPHLNRWLRRDEYEKLKDHVCPPAESDTALAARVDWRKLVSMRECYTLILARFFTDPVIYFVIFWFPEYLQKERGFNLAMVGGYAWVPFIFLGAAYVLGGWLSGRLMEAGWKLGDARKFVMLLGAVVMPAAILAPLVPKAWMAIGATCFLTFGHGFWVSNLQALPIDLFRGREVGTATGFSGMGGAVGGVLATLGTGWLVERFSYAPIFVLAGLMHPLSIVLVYRLLPDRYFKSATESRS